MLIFLSLLLYVYFRNYFSYFGYKTCIFDLFII